jgi:hypothetical protein
MKTVTISAYAEKEHLSREVLKEVFKRLRLRPCRTTAMVRAGKATVGVWYSKAESTTWRLSYRRSGRLARFPRH